ncbi:MAG: hypothetical protein V1695_00125 [Candidatus Uhrbacteria bacterium]
MIMIPFTLISDAILFKDWKMGITGVGVALVELILIANISYLAFLLVDKVGMHDLQTEATVVDKEYHKSYMIQFDNVPTQIPERWEVIVESEKNEQGGVSVEESVYDYLEIEQVVQVTYHRGRISGRFYPTELEILR